jgi:hypothetical protein
MPYLRHTSLADSRRRGGGGWLFYLIVLILVISGLWWLDRHGGTFLSGLEGLPNCDSPNAPDMVNDTLDSAPAGKVLGLKIIDFQSPRQIGRSEKEVKCTAQVKLNNATSGLLHYRFYIENDQLYVEAKLP